MKNNMKWFCENAHNLEKFSGRWVIFNSEQGIVGAGPSLPKALKLCSMKTQTERPFVFHVPSKRELTAPVFTRKK